MVTLFIRLLVAKESFLPSTNTTCWTIIEAASRGQTSEREEFAQRYEGPVRAYLTNRWRHSRLLQMVDDTVQDVFIECFRADGPLHRADRNRSRGFRPYLFGIVRNVARGTERRHRRGNQNEQESPIDLELIESDETALTQVFDRAWALSIMKQAAQRQSELAQATGKEAVQRVELLRKRFQDGLPIREIAKEWNVEAADLHREQTKARHEFLVALLDVLSFHNPGSNAEIQHEAEKMLAMLR